MYPTVNRSQHQLKGAISSAFLCTPRCLWNTAMEAKKKSEYSQRKALIIIKANIIIINNQSKHKFDKAVQFDEVIKSLFRRTRMVIEVSFCYDPKRSLNGKDSLMDPYVTLQAVVSANTPWIAHENRPRNWMFGINQRWRDIRYNEMDRCDICIY